MAATDRKRSSTRLVRPDSPPIQTRGPRTDERGHAAELKPIAVGIDANRITGGEQEAISRVSQPDPTPAVGDDRQRELVRKTRWQQSA